MQVQRFRRKTSVFPGMDDGSGIIVAAFGDHSPDLIVVAAQRMGICRLVPLQVAHVLMVDSNALETSAVL